MPTERIADGSRASAAVKIVFLLALVLSSSGLISPPIALTLGIVFGLGFTHPFQSAGTFARFLLQASVVALGFGMNLQDVVKAGRSGFVYTAGGICFALLLGLAIGKVLAVRGNSSFLISTGTAICGGSAIAAVGPILQASEEEMAVSLGTIFILSSVVGAAAKYGPVALVIGTTVKLGRALWIVPLALGTAAVKHSKSGVKLPWFILLFCLAAVANTYLPAISRVSHALYFGGRLGLTATLFLIGSGISMVTVRQVGWRPLLQGVLLWMAVAATSL